MLQSLSETVLTSQPTTTKPGNMEESKTYVGNGLVVDKEEIKSDWKITVIGNSSFVSVKNNEGEVEVFGDNCRIRMESGNGRIGYVGNNGIITVGKDVDENKIQRSGTNVKVVRSKKMVDMRHERKRKMSASKIFKATSPANMVILGTPYEVMIPAALCVPEALVF